jgi:hypothetical protein
MKNKYQVRFTDNTWNYSRGPFGKIIYEPPINYLFVVSEKEISGWYIKADNWFRGLEIDGEELRFREDSLTHSKKIKLSK